MLLETRTNLRVLSSNIAKAQDLELHLDPPPPHKCGTKTSGGKLVVPYSLGVMTLTTFTYYL